MVVLGIDAHKRSHTVVVVDNVGRKLGERTIGTTTADHLAMLTWAEQFVPIGFGRSRTAGTCRAGWSAILSAASVSPRVTPLAPPGVGRLTMLRGSLPPSGVVRGGADREAGRAPDGRRDRLLQVQRRCAAAHQHL